MSIKVKGIYYVHVCEQARGARSAGNSAIEHNNNNNNSHIFYSSRRDIKAVVRSHNEENLSVILSHECTAQ